MFNDRDVYILGGGGLLAVLCLLPNWPYWLKIFLALLIMVLAMVVALLKIGADRRTLEQQLYYYFRYRTSPKRYQYYGRPAAAPVHGDPANNLDPQAPASRSMNLAWDEMNIYFLLTVWLGVIGVYFTAWLRAGGDRQLANFIERTTMR
jgi:hypothetical protein